MSDRKKKKVPAGISPAQEAQQRMTDAVNKSIDEWRASQGLPPIDRSRKARNDGNE